MLTQWGTFAQFKDEDGNEFLIKGRTKDRRFYSPITRRKVKSL